MFIWNQAGSMRKAWSVVQSVLASFLGVQSQNNYEADFTQKSPIPFIATGIVLVILFVVSLIVLVNILV